MRKEINLPLQTVAKLQARADKKKWSVKKYMEHTLESHVKNDVLDLMAWDDAKMKLDTIHKAK